MSEPTTTVSADPMPSAATTAPPAARVTLRVDLAAVLTLAAQYEVDKAGGMTTRELVLKYLGPAFQALGYPLPAELLATLQLVARLVK